MKKRTLSQLAVLGMTSGLMMVANGGGSLYADVSSVDATQLMSKAKKKCSSTSKGCGGEIAMRTQPLTLKADAEFEDQDIDQDVEEEASEKNEETESPLIRRKS